MYHRCNTNLTSNSAKDTTECHALIAFRYPRQNDLAIALRELGRIERRLFILDWLQNVELRRRVHAGLNKGEARNALARAVNWQEGGLQITSTAQELVSLRRIAAAKISGTSPSLRTR